MIDFHFSHFYGTNVQPLPSTIVMAGPNSSNGPPKPTFPAYQHLPGGSGMASLPEPPSRRVNMVPPVGAGCKLMHPDDDISLVSGVRCVQ